jgi:hypothetical protein
MVPHDWWQNKDGVATPVLQPTSKTTMEALPLDIGELRTAFRNTILKMSDSAIY